MARRLLLLATLAAAGAALAACDNPATGILSTAQTGQCFAVTGKDGLGQPKLIRTECGTPGSAPTAAAATQACMKPAAPVAAPPPCGQVAAAAGPGLTYSQAKVRYAGHAGARVVRKAVRHKGFVHYEYVPASGEVFNSSSRYEYARPSQTTELAGGYTGYTSHREDTYVAPPPPPPPAPVARDYVERRYESRDYESRAYASESSSSSAYTSSSASRRKPCNCRRDGPVGHAQATSSQYDRDGYLTWPGKARY
jgi:hypothetical protein